MSRTTTIRGRNLESGSVILSPFKGFSSSLQSDARTATDLAELWKWTFDRKAVASCFVEDVFSMKDNLDQGKRVKVRHYNLLMVEKASNFFWLGRVPCRNVRIVGLVVGVQVSERYIRYTVDDGTAVVDCRRQIHRPRTPVKKKQGTETRTTNIQKETPYILSKPVARVGTPVCVVGRVARRYETREIVVDVIEPCASHNDEPLHWLEVHRLHKEYYWLATPFKIPQPAVTSQPPSPAKPFTSGGTALVTPTTPSTLLSTPSTAYSVSPGSKAPSPSKSTAANSPVKLRHPSRLHSRDLNGNTFRIYVKHYMDRIIQMNLSNNIDHELNAGSRFHDSETPTKRSRQAFSNKTPRANVSTSYETSLRTPRPHIPVLSFNAPPQSMRADPGHPRLAGFTVSYLRRVPELADMATRVVNAVTRRRHREEKKRIKEAGNSSGTTRPPNQSTPINLEEEASKLAPRVKRLFQSTVVQLLREGSIILWDGPVLPFSPFSIGSQGGVWKSTSTSMSVDNSVFSVPSASRVEESADDMELSEPDDNEEAFMPLTPRFMAEVVESVIRKLANAPIAKRESTGHISYGAATKERILAYLKRDDRWRYLSEWSVDEALNLLRADGKASCVAKEYWELSI